MRRIAFSCLLLLAACAREEPLPAEAVSFRDRTVPIASTTRGGPGDLTGEWVVSEAFPGGAFARPGSRVALSGTPEGRVIWTIDGWTVATAPDGPGRYRWEDLRLWVLWVDDDFRTAVVGTPEGTFGWIMDRPGAASPDRTVAAREVLDFNGYDVAQLTR